MSKPKNGWSLRDFVLFAIARTGGRLDGYLAIASFIARQLGYKSRLDPRIWRVYVRWEIQVLHRDRLLSWDRGRYRLTGYGQDRVARLRDKWVKSIHFQGSWLTPQVVAIARTAKKNELGVLADALDEAGADQEIIAYLKHPLKQDWLRRWLRQQHKNRLLSTRA